jgi:hypothetical protein
MARDVSAQFVQAVLGSNNPIITVDIVNGGDVIRSGLKPVGGVIEADWSRQIETNLNGLKVVDDETNGSRLSDVIHSIGTQAIVYAGFDMAGNVETIPIGTFDIAETESIDSWQWFSWTTKALKTGSVVSMTGFDLISVVDQSDFLTPTQPTTGADAWQTIADLCVGIVSVLDPGFTSKVIPAGLTFDWSRLSAIQAIADLWDAKAVMTSLGQLTLVTDSTGEALGDFGVKINIANWQDSTSSKDIRNGITFIGRDAKGNELIGIATEDDGLARWDGPFGRRPKQISSDVADTQAKVDAAAKTWLAREIAGRGAVQTADALWNPIVELRDLPRLVLPDSTVSSKVLGYTLPLTGGAMSVTLRRPLVL